MIFGARMNILYHFHDEDTCVHWMVKYASISDYVDYQDYNNYCALSMQSIFNFFNFLFSTHVFLVVFFFGGVLSRSMIGVWLRELSDSFKSFNIFYVLFGMFCMFLSLPLPPKSCYWSSREWSNKLWVCTPLSLTCTKMFQSESIYINIFIIINKSL